MPMTANSRPAWAQALADPTSFEREQAQLAQVWTLLGLTTDIPDDGDWIRATLGGRSVFVQRFGDTLSGFENRCAHRSYPLRTKDKGNGAIRCGFHHWQYNKDGLAVGIPACQELFGMTPRELGARLNPVEVATCGMLIFGRFPAPHATETLEQYLGDTFPILQALCNRRTAPYYLARNVAANWKLLFHVSLDDYHIVAVHPSTFGKRGYLKQDAIRYFRRGWHSAYFTHAEQDAMAKMIAQCRDGSYRPQHYRIFQIFPNLAVVQLRTVQSWYILLMQYVPISTDRTLVRTWFYPAPFPVDDKSWLHRLFRRYIELWLPLFVRHYIRKIAGEDHSICEQIQTIASQIDGWPILGLQEERLVWFEQAYAQAMAAAPTPPAAQAAAIVRNAEQVALIGDKVALSARAKSGNT
jgi:phenylpropionate dioxygenase-like ring-hydroxylating dioxygenase large terminal subunit